MSKLTDLLPAPESKFRLDKTLGLKGFYKVRRKDQLAASLIRPDSATTPFVVFAQSEIGRSLFARL